MKGEVFLRIMGLDVGDKTIGVSVSDELFLTAQAVKTIRRKSKKKDLYVLKGIIEEKDVGKIVVGLPFNMNGTLGPQSQKVKDFVNWIEENIDIECIYEDERLTTAIARRYLIEADMSRKKRKEVIDTVAAVHILQSYLDKTKRGE